jgi:RsiW-degrading membrane proteinase PrsW (M82 family)
MDFIVIVYIIFGLLPSLSWLAYYLRKDAHPEPKKMIIKIFFWGALVTLPVFFVQIGLTYLLAQINFDATLKALVYWFLVIALSEELFKYSVVRLKVMNSPELDEPLDIMLYMVIAALGFAAVENILYLFSPVGQLSFSTMVNRTLMVTLVRFIGATFLHTLCSATIGYSLAISFCQVKRKYLSFAAGVIMAMLLHGLYDLSIITLNGSLKIIVPTIIILTLAFLVFSGFEKLKKMKSICKIERPSLKNK